MNVFVAGATGVIGRPLIGLLRGAGHSVIGTTRSAAKLADIEALGAKGVAVDVDIKLICKDAKSAEESRKLIDGGLVAFKKQAEAGGRGGDEIPKEVIEIIDSIKVENKGVNVLLTGQVKTDAVLKVAKTFQRAFR